MIKKAIFVPLLVIAIMSLSTQFGIPGFWLCIASLIVYFAFSLSGSLLLRRALHWSESKSAFNLSILIFQFAGISLLAASSSFSSETLNGASYKPLGVVDVAGMASIACLSTGAVAISMVIVDSFFHVLSKMKRRQ